MGDSVTVNMGYRVYEDATKTRARIHRDYVGINFELLGTTDQSSATYLSVGMAFAALTFSLAF